MLYYKWFNGHVRYMLLHQEFVDSYLGLQLAFFFQTMLHFSAERAHSRPF